MSLANPAVLDAKVLLVWHDDHKIPKYTVSTWANEHKKYTTIF